MALYTESAACDGYKQAIRDHRERLEALLYPQPWPFLERNRCLTGQEIDAIKASGGGLKHKVKQLVDFILTKSDIATLSSFSKALYSKNSTKASEIFPFADSLGGIPVVDPKKALPAPSDKPAVLWLVSSEADSEKVLSVVPCTPNGPRRLVGNFSSQEYSVTGRISRSIHIAYPAVASTTKMRDPVDLLHQFTPRPHLLVMTGTCRANEGGAQLGDVCVVKPGNNEPSLVAEIEHMIDVWRLENGGSIVPEGLKLPRSRYREMVCLARISTELQLSEEERSPWFKELALDTSKPLGANSGVRRCVPDPDNLLQSDNALTLWSRSHAGPLFRDPCDQLKKEAKSSMLFASQSHSFMSDPTEPQFLFGRASRFQQSQGTLVCSPPVADLYKAALMVSSKLDRENSSKNHRMLYIAALGVSSIDGQDCKEEDFEQFSNILSIHIMWKIVNHLFKKIHV